MAYPKNHDGDDLLGGEDRAKSELPNFFDRIDRVEGEIAELRVALKEIYAEAKSRGYDTTVMREVVRLRRKDQAEIDEHRALVDLYMNVLL
jgi:uncharacterized protein (UPF0335 family)